MSNLIKHSILCTGLTCLDIVSECQLYPKEDDKVGTTTVFNRCVSQLWQRGGNASNNCTVLAALGAAPTLACTLANSPEKQFLLSDMQQCDICTDYIVYHNGRQCPSSVVLCAMDTGSRTIVHSNQNLPELTLEDFDKMPLEKFSWIHFEGRNVEAVMSMQRLVRSRAPYATLSVELEKARSDMSLLAEIADVVFVSKDYAKMLGFEDMTEAAEGIANTIATKCRTVIVGWGDAGACARSYEGTVYTSVAYPPPRGVVDSLGAGDTFIAATIYSLSKDHSLQDSLVFGCKIAGLKVGLKGWQELRRELRQLDWVKSV